MSSTQRSNSPVPSSGSSAGSVTPPSPTSASRKEGSLEEKERRLAEERALAALRLQRKQRLDALVRKRKTNLKYLQKIHEGGHFWLNAIHFSIDEIKHYARTVVPKGRALSFFHLGMSVSNMLSLNPGTATVRAFSQLIEEWEYYNAGTAMQSVKYMMAKNSPCVYPQTIPADGNMTDLTRPLVYKFNNSVVYEYLDVTHIAFDLDYLEVLRSLCDVLYKLYDKLFHVECFSNQVVYDTIIRLDARIKHHVINMIAKEFAELCERKTKLETGYLRSLTENKIGETYIK